MRDANKKAVVHIQDVNNDDVLAEMVSHVVYRYCKKSLVV